MCSDCGHFPCVSRCPNYEEKPLFYCDRCGEGIFDGDKFYQIDGIIDVKTLLICEDCMSDFGKYAEHEDCEPDGCDLAKARAEAALLERMG